MSGCVTPSPQLCSAAMLNSTAMLPNFAAVCGMMAGFQCAAKNEK